MTTFTKMTIDIDNDGDIFADNDDDDDDDDIYNDEDDDTHQ